MKELKDMTDEELVTGIVEQAKIVMARGIAKKQEVLPVVVLGWLRDYPNSFEVRIEMEFKEIEDTEAGA